MALTPAEKQRRYRAKLRERLAAADDSLHPDAWRALKDEWRAKQRELEAEIAALRRETDSEAKFREWLFDEYRAAGIALLEPHADDIREASIAEFAVRDGLDLVDLQAIMAKAGREAAVDILQRRYTEWSAAQPRPEPKAAPKRRRKAP